MTKHPTILIGIQTLVLFAAGSFSQSTEPFSIRGEVLAYQESSRCPKCGPPRGTAVFTEYWIVKVLSSESSAKIEKSIIIVEFPIVKGGISDKELRKPLMMSIRKSQTGQCKGFVLDKSRKLRLAAASDYVAMKAKIDIPDPESLACFVATDVQPLKATE